MVRTIHLGSGEQTIGPNDATVIETAVYDRTGRVIGRGSTNLDPVGPVLEEVVAGAKVGEVRRAWLPPNATDSHEWVICDYEVRYIGK